MSAVSQPEHHGEWSHIEPGVTTAVRGIASWEKQMEALVIHAASRDSAEDFCAALEALGAKLVESDNGRCRIEIPVDGDREILAMLSAIETCVCARGDGPAELDLDGHRYTLHPTDAA